MRVILINGAPRTGKDTAARAILRAIPGAVRIGFADALKEATHGAYGMPDARYGAFEGVKDEPRPEFRGVTPRAAYIGVSEQLFKPLHGPEVFGEMFLARARASRAPLVVVPDAGFAAEAMPTLRAIGVAHMLLIRLHAEGRGKTFAGDSRSHIDLPGVLTLDLHNDGEQAAFEAEVVQLVRDWLWVDVGRIADGPLHADQRALTAAAVEREAG